MVSFSFVGKHSELIYVVGVWKFQIILATESAETFEKKISGLIRWKAVSKDYFLGNCS
jgi:hypothetical protein